MLFVTPAWKFSSWEACIEYRYEIQTTLHFFRGVDLQRGSNKINPYNVSTIKDFKAHHLKGFGLDISLQ